MRFLRRNVVGLVAIFIALSGSAYAVSRLPVNSVGTKQLRDGAVTGKKTAKHTLTGDNIASATLGTRPQRRPCDERRSREGRGHADVRSDHRRGRPRPDIVRASVRVRAGGRARGRGTDLAARFDHREHAVGAPVSRRLDRRSPHRGHARGQRERYGLVLRQRAVARGPPAPTTRTRSRFPRTR